MWRRTYVIFFCYCCYCHCCRLLLLLLLTRRLVNIINIVKSSTQTNTAAYEQIWPQFRWKHTIHRQLSTFVTYWGTHTYAHGTHMFTCWFILLFFEYRNDKHTVYGKIEIVSFVCVRIVWLNSAPLIILWRCLVGNYIFSYKFIFINKMRRINQQKLNALI